LIERETVTEQTGGYSAYGELLAVWFSGDGGIR
jgi:hypothetical protein